MDKLSLLPRCEPFYISGGPIGCLVVHGFTGAPQEMRELGQRLGAAGYTVYGPRLTHHGTFPSDMIRSQWQDWYFSALDGYHMLRANCEKVIVIGLSMGGATVLLLSAWEEVDALVTMAAPVALQDDPRLRYTRQISALYPYDPPLEPDWRDKFDPDGRIAYPVSPIHAVAELRDYLEVVQEQLPKITAPVLMMHAVDDETVAPINMANIYRQIGSEAKQQVLLDEGSHVLTEGSQKENVFKQLIEFVNEQAEK